MKTLLALLFLSLLSGAQTVPPTMFGLNLHPQVVANRNQIPWPTFSFGAFRFWGTQTTWNDLNPSEGTYNFAEMDAWFAAAQKNGMADFLYTFGETPAWAASQAANKGCDHYPTSCNAPKDLNADGTGADQYWKNFVTAIVKHANGRIKYWEVWNEPDILPSPSGKGEWSGTNAQLVRMAKDAYAIIKANCPSCQVTTPCPVDSGNGQSISRWFPAYVKAGGLAYADIVAFHGYIDPAIEQKPEAEAQKVAAIKAAINGASTIRYTSDGSTPIAAHGTTLANNGTVNVKARDTIKAIAVNANSLKPIWDTEGDSGLNAGLPNAQLQAAYLARMYLVQLSLGVSRFYWWQYGNTEMGTLSVNTLALTSSGQAYVQLNKWLVGNTMTKPCSVTGTVWSCKLNNAMIVWDAGQTCSANSCGQTQWTYPASYTSSTSLAEVSAKLSGGKVAIGAEPILLK